jgi:DNA/RNA endonuclease G (NUC1)
MRWRALLVATILGTSGLLGSLVGCSASSSTHGVSAPAITTQPASVTVTAGNAATFTVAASGTGPLTFQWSKGTAAITGATSAAYSIPVTAAGDAGTYTVVITNDAGKVTSAAATLTVTPAPEAPTITSQPANVTVNAGTPASFTVAATGTTPISYQWSKGGTIITGATAATYTIASPTALDAGSYSVLVTNPMGHVASSAATLTINVAPAILTQPANLTVNAGQPAAFTVAASGTAPVSYQWYKGTATVGSNAATLTIAAAAAADAGSYTVKVTNVAGTATSAAATLAVTVPPAITTQPSGFTVNAGQPATFTVVAAGTGPFTYVWKKDGTVTGGNTATLTIATVTAGDAGSYTVTVSNAAGSITSSAAALAVNLPVTITTQPADVSVTVGQTASFTVAASGTGPFTYQWLKNGTAISLATLPTYTITSAQVADAGSYTVKVTNLVGSVLSNPAVLVTNLVAPTIQTQPQTRTVTPPDPVTFTVAATANNGGTLTYAWKKDGVAIAGATTSSYTLPATEFATNSAAFSVTVAEGSLSTDSASAYAIASVAAPTYAGDPIAVPSRPLTNLSSLHVDSVKYPNGAFRLGYDEALKNPVWTAYVNFPVKTPYANSTADYTTDLRLAAPQVGKDDYTGIYTGGANFADSYDRGHQVPRADVSYRYTTVAGDDATIMSNLVPQISQFNQQVWQKLEDVVGGTNGGSTDGLTSFKGRVWVYTGSVFAAAPTWWNSTITTGLKIAIPVGCYKIMVHEKTPGNPEVLAVLLPNVWGLANNATTITGYVTSVAYLESLTGLNFFPNLATLAPGVDIAAWKAGVDARGWKTPLEQAAGPNVHVIQPSWDLTVTQNDPVTFQAAATSTTGTVASPTWNFGDSSPTATGYSTTHTYTTAGGPFSATFTVQDGLGASNTITRVITVKPLSSANQAPTTTPATLPAVNVLFNATGNQTFVVADDTTAAAAITVAATSSNLTLLPAANLAAANASGTWTLTLTPVTGQSGTSVITVTITDKDSAVTTKTFNFTVAPAVVVGTPKLIISQYYEGGSPGTDKWIEITNVGNGTYDAAVATIYACLWANPKSASNPFTGTPVTGTLAPGETVLIRHGSTIIPVNAYNANGATAKNGSRIIISNTVANFNGNDVVYLSTSTPSSTTDLTSFANRTDVIGGYSATDQSLWNWDPLVPVVNPAGWGPATPPGQDRSYYRNFAVTAPNPTYTPSEWTIVDPLQLSGTNRGLCETVTATDSRYLGYHSYSGGNP